MPPGGPHSHRCPFKKEEILLINKRPNQNAELAPPDLGQTGVLSGTKLAPGSTQGKAWRPPLATALRSSRARVRDTRRARRRDLGEPRNSPGSVYKVQPLHRAKGCRAAPSGGRDSPPTRFPPHLPWFAGADSEAPGRQARAPASSLAGSGEAAAGSEGTWDRPCP